MRQRYPRTPHLPWSPGATPDDVRGGAFAFEGSEVVVTEKLDGENTTLLRDGLHARSPETAHHPSRTRMKALHAQVASSLPEGVKVCGENVLALHSLAYTDLLGWFYAFSVWDGDTVLDWDATVRFAHTRGLPTPSVLYRGPWDEKKIRALRIDRARQEGYVVRTVAGFAREDFGRHLAKWVRRDHVQTDAHWMSQPVVWNALGPEALPWTLASGGPVNLKRLRAWLGCGSGTLWDRGGLGEPRLEGLVASQLLDEPLGECLPELATRIGLQRATRVVALASLQARLRLPVDDATREGGLVSLARSTDLTVLHGLALHTAEDAEPIRWVQLHAEEAGLFQRDALAPWCERLRDLLPDVEQDRWTWLRGEALWAWSSGRLRSPEEAAAWLYPLLERPFHTLTVLVGPSGSGKSTLARDLPGVVLALDDLRGGFERKQEAALVRGVCERLHRELRRGDVVWDATGITPAQRAVPLQIARELRARTRIVRVLTTRADAERRNRGRRHSVPDGVVARQWHRLRWPLRHEAHEVL